MPPLFLSRNPSAEDKEWDQVEKEREQKKAEVERARQELETRRRIEARLKAKQEAEAKTKGVCVCVCVCVWVGGCHKLCANVLTLVVKNSQKNEYTIVLLSTCISLAS